MRAETVFSDALFLVWFTLLLQRIRSKANVVLVEIVAVAAAVAVSAITEPIIKFQNYGDFIY